MLKPFILRRLCYAGGQSREVTGPSLHGPPGSLSTGERAQPPTAQGAEQAKTLKASGGLLTQQ